MSAISYFDGCFVEEFALTNRAFEYGDGLFESIIGCGRQIQFWESHYRRLTAACRALHLEIPENFNETFLREIIFDLAQQNGFTEFYRIKINVWRQTGGLYTPTTNKIHHLIRLYTYTPKTEYIKAKAIFFRDVPLVYSIISPYKTLNALPYVLAGISARKNQAQEAILFSSQGYVAETVASNIFWIKQETIFTPSLQCGGKKGIMQEKIFEQAQKLAISLKIGEFSPQDLLSADVVFTSNIAGIESIRQIENQNFKTEHPYLDIFRKLLIIHQL
jgi:branched-chain amino acid aminotransferase/4-amino-4-deoxychorismate lyase